MLPAVTPSPVRDSRNKIRNYPDDKASEMLQHKEFGLMLGKAVQQLRRKAAFSGNQDPCNYTRGLFAQRLGKGCTCADVHALFRDMGMQATEWRVKAFWAHFNGRNPSVPTAQLLGIFQALIRCGQQGNGGAFGGSGGSGGGGGGDSSTEGRGSASGSASRVFGGGASAKQSPGSLWQRPDYNANAPLVAFGFANNPRKDVRRPSAIDGSSIQLLGARRISDERELQRCKDVFLDRKMDRSMMAAQAAVFKKIGKKNWESTFNQFDTTGKGEITLLQMRKALKKMGVYYTMSEQLVKHLFDEIDTNGNGVIEKNEWMEFMDHNKRRELIKRSHKFKHLAHDHVYSRAAYGCGGFK
eukprot:g2066.t1